MQPLSKLWDDVLRASSAALDELKCAPGPKPTRQMCDLLVLGEDRRIESHAGVDPVALIRSVWMTSIRRRRQGGSTIAMQLVRTITGRYQRTLWRKVTEIFLAIRLARSFDRIDIARIYLWLAYYGWNMHGFQQACEKLSIALPEASSLDSAMIVARLKYPHPRFGDQQQFRRINLRARHLLALESTYVNGPSTSGNLNHGTISNS